MGKVKEQVIRIEGIVFANGVGCHVDQDEFWDAFVDFLDEHNWMFGGAINSEDADE